MANKNSDRLDKARSKEAESARDTTERAGIYYRAKMSNLDSRDKKQGKSGKGR